MRKDDTDSGMSVDVSIDPELVTKILTGFIRDCLRKTATKKGIVGLSGGLDSSVVATLCARAVGTERVLGVMIPSATSAPASRKDAETLVRKLGIASEVVDITTVADAFFRRFPDAGPVRRGNVFARQRMIVLYDISAREDGLVIGTSNKSELLLGYGTIFGDLACAVNPVGDLYKTQMRQLAEYLDIPESIRTKAPTADLVAGQTDEGDLGFTYEEVDRFLYLWVDKRYSEADLEREGYSRGFIKNVIDRVRRNHFKRIPPLIAKLSSGTIGHEFRYAWEWSTRE